jgi:uncharacterized protein YyaL (SSP411 family)
VLNLLVLSHLVSEPSRASDGYAEKIVRTLGAFAPRMAQLPRALPMMLTALSTYHAGMAQIVIVGGAQPEATVAMTSLVSASYLPGSVTIPVWPQHRAALARLLPWIGFLEPKDGLVTAHVCREFTCETPTTSIEGLRAQLEALRRPAPGGSGAR